MVGEGFEPSKAKPADLQSALVDRLSTPPCTKPAIVDYVQAGCQQHTGNILCKYHLTSTIDHIFWQTCLYLAPKRDIRETNS